MQIVDGRVPIMNLTVSQIVFELAVDGTWEERTASQEKIRVVALYVFN